MASIRKAVLTAIRAKVFMNHTLYAHILALWDAAKDARQTSHWHRGRETQKDRARRARSLRWRVRLDAVDEPLPLLNGEGQRCAVAIGSVARTMIPSADATSTL
jgi:hypothetical protein